MAIVKLPGCHGLAREGGVVYIQAMPRLREVSRDQADPFVRQICHHEPLPLRRRSRRPTQSMPISSLVAGLLTMPGRRCSQRERTEHALLAPQRQHQLYSTLVAQLPQHERALVGRERIPPADGLLRVSDWRAPV